MENNIADILKTLVNIEEQLRIANKLKAIEISFTPMNDKLWQECKTEIRYAMEIAQQKIGY